MTIERTIQKTLIARFLEQNPLIQVVLGPRQVGKTTAIKAAIQGSGLYQTADSPTPLSADFIVQWWNEALSSDAGILAIDEIQKIPGWAEVIKKLWDNSEKKLKLVLSGSAAISIEKNLKESLAGRFELIRATHWSFSEFQKLTNDDSIEKYIEFGCYPGSMRFIDDLERWGDYVRDSIVEPAIGRDILQLYPVENPALFRQVFALSVALPAQIVSLNKLQSKLQDKGAIATIQHYLNLLGSAFLVSGVQKFSSVGFRTKSSSPKIIVHDNALLRAFERPIQNSVTNPRLGHYFENTVGARFIEAGWDVYYWKDKNDEVDFIVNGPGGEKWAIEVKTSSISSKELSGLQKFCKQNPTYEPHLLSLVDQKIDGIKSLAPKTILSLL